MTVDCKASTDCFPPTQTNVPPVAPAAGACAAPAGEPATKKKRSLEDLMGGGERSRGADMNVWPQGQTVGGWVEGRLE